MCRVSVSVLLLLLCCAGVRTGADAVLPGAWDPSRVSLSISNDALGPGPVSEWDDLRTFALALRVRLNGILDVEAGYETLTWRDAGPLGASRIDRLYALLGWKLPEVLIGPLHLEAALASGLELCGNLGSAQLQASYHRSVGILRPAPESYDPLTVVAPAGALSARLYWQGGPWRAAVLAGVSGELPVGFQAGAGLQLATGSGASSAALTLRYLVDPVRGVSPTLDRVAASDSGIVLDLDCSAGLLRSSLDHNLSTGVSNGAVGFQFGGAGQAEEVTRELPLALEVSFPLDSIAPGPKVLVPVPGQLLRVCLSEAAGWWGQVSTGSTALRFADYACGLEGRLLLHLGRLEAQVGCGLGPFLTLITRNTLGEARSTILERWTLAGLRLEPLLRAGFVTHEHGRRSLISGVGVALELNAALQSAPLARNAAVKILLFSEERLERPRH